jgi:hypothetical protein
MREGKGMLLKSRTLFCCGLLAYMLGMWLVVNGTARAANDNALETPKDSSGCCVTMGNVDQSSDNLVTMGDVTVLIDHLYITLTPLVCPDEGNVDFSADGLVTMDDLTVMVYYMFIFLWPDPACDDLPYPPYNE